MSHTPTLGEDGYIEAVAIPLLQGQHHDLEVEDIPENMVIKELQPVLDRFLSMGEKERQTLARHLYAYYQDITCAIGEESMADQMPKLKSPEDIFEHIELMELRITSGSVDPSIFVVMSGECAWEPEHGLMFSYRDGNQLAMVSPFGHVCNADAHDDISKNKWVYIAHHGDFDTLADDT